MLYPIRVLLLIVVVSSVAICADQKAAQLTIGAQIVDRQGTTTVIDRLQIRRLDRCGTYGHWQGIPTETVTYYDSIPIDTGAYIIWIPLSIARSITNLESKSTLRPRYTIRLSDDTTVSGEVDASQLDLVAESELGKTELSFQLIKEIKATKEPLAIYEFKRNGLPAKLIMPDGTEIPIGGVALTDQQWNKNGCYTGQVYPESFLIQIGAAEQNVDLGKLAAIWLADPSSPGIPTFKMLTKTGKEYEGSIKGQIGIEGITSIGKFKVRTVVPLRNTQSKDHDEDEWHRYLTPRIEFKTE